VRRIKFVSATRMIFWESCVSMLLVCCGYALLNAQATIPQTRQLVANRSLVNVVVLADNTSKLKQQIELYVNQLAQDDWGLFLHYLNPSSVIDNGGIQQFKKLFGNPGWAVIMPNGKVVAYGNNVPTSEEFEKIIMATDITKPIPQLRKYLKEHPNNIDAKNELIRLLRSAAYKRTKNELGITMNSVWENKDAKEYSVLPAAGFVIPDAQALSGYELEPEKDLIIWGKYAQELSESFRNGDWLNMNLAWDASATLPIEACSPLMRTTFRRLRPQVEQAIELFPISKNLWLLWLNFQACIKDESVKFDWFNQIAPLPKLSGIQWPPDGAIVPLVRSSYEKQDWDTILQLTEKTYENFCLTIKGQTEVSERVPGFKIAINLDWNGKFKQRMEALIRLDRIDEADDFVNKMYLHTDTRSFVNNAIQIAKPLNPSLAKKWQLMVGEK